MRQARSRLVDARVEAVKPPANPWFQRLQRVICVLESSDINDLIGPASPGVVRVKGRRTLPEFSLWKFLEIDFPRFREISRGCE
jgi:hypothetical protein